MSVQLIVDCFGIDTEEAIVVGKTEAEINTLRLRVQEHLAAKNPALLRLRLTSFALLKHFKFIEGAIDVLPTKTFSPRLIHAERLKTQLPDWLRDEWIVELNLVNSEQNVSFENACLRACHHDFLTGNNFDAFVAALNVQTTLFLELLAIDTIKARLIEHLTMDLAINAENATLFITELSKSEAIGTFLENFAYQQYLSLIRQKIRDYGANIALPAQTFPVEFLSALPLLPLLETQAKNLPTDLIEILKGAARKILHREWEATVLAEFVLVDWECVWREIDSLCVESPPLITPELLKSCQRFESADAKTLVEKFEKYLAVSHYRQLAQNASVEEALDWSVGYFEYLRIAFLSRQTLDESINVSFTDWLLSQASRIARSESDWRFCAKQIHDYLANDYLVIVTVIDALSALNQDILLEELATLDNLTVITDTLFAPLPTLTEIGKLAVLTGKPTYSLPNNSEIALQQTYQMPLKIIKSWEDTNERINAETNLVVFFENRIDERLHDCVSFKNHCADIKPIVRQLKNSLQSWLKDAANRDVVFFITADHGMTVTNGRYIGVALGETKDRTFKLKNYENLSDDFVLVKQDSKDDYAVPKTRLALTDAPLAHGGLTPEEVLIPFIKLIRPTFAATKLPIDAEIVGDCLRLSDTFWQVELRLTAAVQVETVRLMLEPPFRLENREPIDIIRAQKSHTLTLKFQADDRQEGLIALGLKMQFKTVISNEMLPEQRLAVNFPPYFLARDTEVQNFEDMF